MTSHTISPYFGHIFSTFIFASIFTKTKLTNTGFTFYRCSCTLTTRTIAFYTISRIISQAIAWWTFIHITKSRCCNSKRLTLLTYHSCGTFKTIFMALFTLISCLISIKFIWTGIKAFRITQKFSYITWVTFIISGSCTLFTSRVA